jgi:metal transporter CNNM
MRPIRVVDRSEVHFVRARAYVVVMLESHHSRIFDLLIPISAPIAYPIARLLDYVLGVEHGNTYKKAELRSFLQFHRTNTEEPLRDDEISILNAVLELNSKSVESIMTPMKVATPVHVFTDLTFCSKDVVCLSADRIMDHKAVNAV